MEENARMLSVYMRPWTLNPMENTEMNPLLFLLGKVYIVEGQECPAWLRSREVADESTVERPEVTTIEQGRKRRRRQQETGRTEAPATVRYSYASSWERYVQGHVVSCTSRRYIVNLLAATAAGEAPKDG